MKTENIYLLGVLLILLSGCATLETENADYVSDFPETEYKFTEIEYPAPERVGVYHKVRRGETIWRIAKAYEVSINDIIETNNIPNAAQVDENQLVFIPGAYTEKAIILDTNESEKDFIWPVNGKVIKYFQVKNGSQLNKGIDIKTREGEGVKASRTGRVVFADYLSGYGNTVILDHSDGYFTVYSNNARLLVKLGEMVLKGKEIAQVGRRNDMVALHFEIRRNSIEDNPLYYLP
ncbi:MAG: LysM peptidoglycan-binding domain-containing M23 family metallopeptidase [Candidatus Omnitrophica bacterium]|nr:LysM peptidoglycan-binding domain-containing M23 family metallopeptidase [Candidatus Omnitrophota bacterium]MBU1997036.1 LysM peptidoglycan-binding domain-containing M23 family metallopeptidase [Candidatus Omnitrophota bacterium]MBU4334399.1 LysM peptidoglycan-binding domain-containing M23 family metallopeptidase [Candidatus Omnitrophota bacterium]